MTNKFISWVRNESPPFEQSPICTVLPVFHLFQGGIATFLQGTATILLFGIKVRTGAGMELWSANTPCQMSQGLLRVLDLSCKWSRIIRGNGGSIIFSFYIKFLLIVNKNKGWAQCLDKKTTCFVISLFRSFPWASNIHNFDSWKLVVNLLWECHDFI